MKFLVPNYSCLQNPWLGGYIPRSPFSLSSVLKRICWTPPQKKNSWVHHCTKQKVKNGVKNRTDIFNFEETRPDFVNSKLRSNKTVATCNMKGEEFHLGPPCSNGTERCLSQRINAHFYSKTNQLHQCIKLFYFGMTLYMFRTFFPSIIRSSRLYIQQQAYVKQILLSAC